MNLDYDATKPCVYVGMTGLTPEARFKKRKKGERANNIVERYSNHFLPKLYAYANPMLYDAAREMGVELAIGLREDG